MFFWSETVKCLAHCWQEPNSSPLYYRFRDGGFGFLLGPKYCIYAEDSKALLR